MAAEDDAPDASARPAGIPIEAVADPALLALVTRRVRPEIVREHRLPTWAGELPHHLDPAAWRTGFLSVQEGGAPFELREAMREVTPQAHLRDLFRPVFSQEPIPLELNELPLDPGGRAAYAELRAALKREPLPRVVRSLELLAELRVARRAFLAAPWQPWLRDDEPRRAAMVAIEPSITG